MFQKISLLIVLIFASFFMMDEGFASITKTYVPSQKISLTGTTANTRFDVAAVLYGSSFSGGYIDTTSRNMEGAFYMNGIGWALMSSGSYQVMIDCGAQPLSSLTSQCQFT